MESQEFYTVLNVISIRYNYQKPKKIFKKFMKFGELFSIMYFVKNYIEERYYLNFIEDDEKLKKFFEETQPTVPEFVENFPEYDTKIFEVKMHQIISKNLKKYVRENFESGLENIKKIQQNVENSILRIISNNFGIDASFLKKSSAGEDFYEIIINDLIKIYREPAIIVNSLLKFSKQFYMKFLMSNTIENYYYMHLLKDYPDFEQFLDKNIGIITEKHLINADEKCLGMFKAKFYSNIQKNLSFEVDKLYNENKDLKEISDTLLVEILFIYKDLGEIIKKKVNLLSL